MTNAVDELQKAVLEVTNGVDEEKIVVLEQANAVFILSKGVVDEANGIVTCNNKKANRKKLIFSALQILVYFQPSTACG